MLTSSNVPFRPVLHKRLVEIKLTPKSGTYRQFSSRPDDPFSHFILAIPLSDDHIIPPPTWIGRRQFISRPLNKLSWSVIGVEQPESRTQCAGIALLICSFVIRHFCGFLSLLVLELELELLLEEISVRKVRSDSEVSEVSRAAKPCFFLLGNLYLDLLSFLSLPIFSLEEEDDFF